MPDAGPKPKKKMRPVRRAKPADPPDPKLRHRHALTGTPDRKPEPPAKT
jgi:hypothetical protein